MYIFNPEHDLCIANGDPNFVPPDSALRFGRDCADIMRLVFPDDGLVVWGWNPTLKQRLVKQGVSKNLLPSDSQIWNIKELSHRRTALDASIFLHSSSRDTSFLIKPVGKEIRIERDVNNYIEKYRSVVLKAPWSGSGRGLRWVNIQNVSPSDIGWWRNVISRQGSVIAERREQVEVDFASLFFVTEKEVSFAGFSLFNTSNGAYNSNILASDHYILSILSNFIPTDTIWNVVKLLKTFISDKFLGKYCGYLGVDMFIAKTEGGFVLCPCVEINVRMTMGLIARRLYDRLLSEKSIDGKYLMKIIYNKDNEYLMSDLDSAVAVLTKVNNQTSYAIAIVDNL